MPKITRDQVKVPADVLADVRETYVDNYMKATRGTGPYHAVRVRPEG